MMTRLFRKTGLVMVCMLGLILSSCSTKKDIIYFQNAKDFETIVDTDTFKAKLKVGDIISIYVSTYDLEVTKPYNLIISNGTGGQLIDYLMRLYQHAAALAFFHRTWSCTRLFLNYFPSVTGYGRVKQLLRNR